MARKYTVWWTTDPDNRDEIESFFVSDQTVEESEKDHAWKKKADLNTRVQYWQQERIRPRVATFPISALYDEETQRNRAIMLCDYMNKLNDAMELAKSQTALIDILTAQSSIDK